MFVCLLELCVTALTGCVPRADIAFLSWRQTQRPFRYGTVWVGKDMFQRHGYHTEMQVSMSQLLHAGHSAVIDMS